MSLIGYAFLFSFRKADLYPFNTRNIHRFSSKSLLFLYFACVCVKIIVYTNFMSDEINEITEEHSDYKPADARDESVKHQLTGMYRIGFWTMLHTLYWNVPCLISMTV